MPLGYKYVERSADSQINWAEVGREASGMLLEVNRIREEKKAAYDEADRESINNLMNTPQGEDRKANDFINNFAHDMIQQKKLNQDLFKRGMIKERDYTLMNQNQMDGTKGLFEIQKLYQEKYKEKMDGVMSGKLQAINIFNMGMVEGYGDFNNSKAVINPLDGTVGIGLMENKLVDGKMVRVLSKNIAPVNVIRGKILHDVPTFDVDAATNNAVATFGSRKDFLYDAATTSRAGTITELMGIDFLSTIKDPTTKKIVSDINKSINDQVGSFFSNQYNLSSVLTENTGKYNDQSFTFDRDEADKDPKKILVKVDPTTQMTTLDNTGKNYEAQKKEAFDWVKRDILRKMDQERTLKVTAQSNLQESAETIARVKKKYETPEPTLQVLPKEITLVRAAPITYKKGKKIIGEKEATGISQPVENLTWVGAEGIQYVVDNIGYDSKTNSLTASGYKASGKESYDKKGKDTERQDVAIGKNVVRENRFNANKVNNINLLAIAVTKYPNPNRPGTTFQNIAEAEEYFKTKYESELDKLGVSDNDPLKLGIK